MARKEIPEDAITSIARHINERSTKNYQIPILGDENNPETPHIFEIVPFDQIDHTKAAFYAVDGSYNFEEFYNGLSIGVYTAGYICFHEGKQVRLNSLDDPVLLGVSYFPRTILVTTQDQLKTIYEELFSLAVVKRLVEFFDDKIEDVLPYRSDALTRNLSSLLSFCQEILEWAAILEILESQRIKSGDFILKDGALRSLHIKQPYLLKLGKLAHDKRIHLVGITKQTPVKTELSYTFKNIDNYLQGELKGKYPFKETDLKRRKLCCWFEVPENVLLSSYGTGDGIAMYAKSGLKGGRGFGLFFAARLDYVEKLQNYDWLVADLNIFDAIPNIEEHKWSRAIKTIGNIFTDLTRLTQEHYILGYPYPLVEAHNFISLKKDFKEEIVARVKLALYKDQKMDHIDIENLFLDTHDRF